MNQNIASTASCDDGWGIKDFFGSSRAVIFGAETVEVNFVNFKEAISDWIWSTFCAHLVN